ncbi:Transcriptional regulator, AraC family [Marinobacterium lacunae]|uniref:Transcriptional regulator, AraC family n=1 Tax=Marinobacterium lacunae TaxID=1232683 RepID=A0A081FVQ4_9GAMM|nr:AraC family transcriptional regulator [Marinobacterium lacunae]KEA62609.1 Transcriptional regulator, AraC family [Marinobacterium lacunae]
MSNSNQDNWIRFKHDAPTGIELVRVRFGGHEHAYDPHWHDSYLIGFTEQGLQQFHCRRQVQRSTPGNSFLIEPGEIHDGESPQGEGFTYRALYLPPDWLHQQLRGIFEELPDRYELHIEKTLAADHRLAGSISGAFLALSEREPRIVREACLDQMLERLTDHISWRRIASATGSRPDLASAGRDFLHAHLYNDVGLSDMAQTLGTDRFRLNRAFKAAYGLSPHAYLIQLRLVRARQLLGLGVPPAEVAAELCFSDQSHLGRWFKRAYYLTPADYRNHCTKLPD